VGRQGERDKLNLTMIYRHGRGFRRPSTCDGPNSIWTH
jgi:hypothetical protein